MVHVKKKKILYRTPPPETSHQGRRVGQLKAAATDDTLTVRVQLTPAGDGEGLCKPQ